MDASAQALSLSQASGASASSALGARSQRRTQRSGVHPGGGITGMPGRNAAHQVLRDLGHRVPKQGVVALVRSYWKLWQSFQRFRKMTE